MEIAAVLGVHDKPALVLDTLDSISRYLTDQILVVIDGGSKVFDKIRLPAGTLKGFYHNTPKSPYRNVALGLKTIGENYPKADWYCYLEPDCLLTSSRLVDNLRLADLNNIWLLGASGHIDYERLSFLEQLFCLSLESSSYFVLGCCFFIHRLFMQRLREMNFFDVLLSSTNGLPEGYFPEYEGGDVSEHIYPTLARKFGGNVGVLSTYDREGRWHGSYRVFPIRSKLELTLDENFPEVSLMHPLKTFDHPVRIYHRGARHAEL